MDSPIAVSLYTPTKDEIRDFSFYDQPEDFSAMTSPLASPLSESSTISRSSSVESLASESESSCESSDEVFFGPIGTKERTLIAKLNKVDLGDSIEPNEKGSDKENSNSRRRVTRRDSREFHRRKTLVFSSRGSIANSPRPWGDGFFLKADKAASSPLAFAVNAPSPPSPQSRGLCSRSQSNPFIIEDDIARPVASSSRRSEFDERITLEVPMSQETVQLEDPEESSGDGLDLPEELDCHSDSLEDLAAEEVTPCTGEQESAAVETIPFCKPVDEVEEPVETTAEKEDEAKQDLTEGCITSVEIRLEELELGGGSMRAKQAHIAALDEAVPTEDIAALSLQEQLVGTITGTDALLDHTESCETVPEVADDAGEVVDQALAKEEEAVCQHSARPEAAMEEESSLAATAEDAEESRVSERFSTVAEQIIRAVEDSESAQQVSALADGQPTDATSSIEAELAFPEQSSQEEELISPKETDVQIDSAMSSDDGADRAQERIVEAPQEEVKEVLASVPPPTPSMASEAGETTFDPESPMPVCRAPKPEAMMVYMSPDGRGADRDIIPFDRELSISPVAHIKNTAAFSLGTFDLSQESFGSSTLRLRQAYSPDKRSMFSPKSRTPNTPLRTPSKAMEPPRSGLVQRSIALPPVTRVLDRTLARPDTAGQRSRSHGSSRKETSIGKKDPLANAGDTAAENDPFLAESAVTPMKSKRKSSRLMKNPIQEDPAPVIQVTSETRPNTPLRNQPDAAIGATPAKPIAFKASMPTSSVLPRAVQSTESRLRQPSKTLLKKPSTSFLPVLKSSATTARPPATVESSSSTIVINNNLSSSASSTSSFDFVQPVPVSKITSYMTSVKSRPIMPMPIKSPAKQPDKFSSGLGAPVRPNRAPIVSTSTGPPVRPNMTPMRNGIRSFGSPVRSNLSPIKNPLFGTPQRSHHGGMSMTTPQRSLAGMDSPQVALNRSRARPLASSLADRKVAVTSNSENALAVSRHTGPTGSLIVASASIPEEVPVLTETSAPVRQEEPATAPMLPAVQPLEIPESLVNAMANENNAAAGTNRRSSRPARTAVNLASSATSEAVKPSKAASKRDRVKPTAPPATKAVNVDIESVTKLNTARNEVVFSAITTIKQRRQGERPRGDPLTVAEKIAALSREERAVRRQLERSGACYESEGESSRPTDNHRRGAGETEDYMTPARPAKRSREDSESPTRAGPQKKGRYEPVMLSQTSPKEERRVKWDKGLIMISDSRNAPSECSSLCQAIKSCLKKTVVLDHLGNVPNANIGAPGLQPLPVEVFKIRYDGEDFSDGEPGETKANKRAEKGKGRRKAAATSEK